MPEGTLSAKQIATKLGTDAKTFRRFLRSSSCTIDAVGQGGRYEFGSGDIAVLAKQFEAWRKPGKKAVPLKPSTQKRPLSVVEEKSQRVILEDDDEPTEDELASIDDERDLPKTLPAVRCVYATRRRPHHGGSGRPVANDLPDSQYRAESPRLM